MVKGGNLVSVVLLGFALSLSLFALWTSPSVEEEQLRKNLSRRQYNRQSISLSKSQNGDPSGNTSFQLSRSRTLAVPVDLQMQSYVRRRRMSSTVAVKNTSKSMPLRLGFGNVIVPSKQVPSMSWSGYFVALALVLGVISIGASGARKVQRWYRSAESLPLLSDDGSDYSSGVAYSSSPSDVGYGTMVALTWTGDSFDKFDL